MLNNIYRRLEILGNRAGIFYGKIQNLLDPGQDNITGKQTILLCLVAYLFGVVMRSFYLWTALDIPATLLNGVPMISTEDGYLFADYVNAHLKQDFSRLNLSLWVGGGHGMITAITYFFTWLLPFDLEQVAVFLPMFIAPLLVIPVIYACRWLGSTSVGFLSALVACISLPYLKRTSFAYFDTDLFALTAPVAIVALGIYTIRNPGILQALPLVIMSELTDWLDKPQTAESIYIPVVIVFLIANFRHPKVWQVLILLCFPFFEWTYWYRLLLYSALACGALYALDHYVIDKRGLNKHTIRLGKYNLSATQMAWQILSILVIIYTIRQSHLFDGLVNYMNIYGSAGRTTGGAVSSSGAGGWNFFQVTGTIVEARNINFAALARETGSQTYLFWLAMAGAVLGLLRFPVLAAGGAFLGIGLYALEGGIRFSMYLVPILSIGAGFLVALIGYKIHSSIKPLRKVKYLNYAIALVLVCFFLYPGAKLAYNYSPRTVAQLPQVNMLKNLDELSTPEDYILSWWDYGYVMSFYADMRNIINGAKHHDDNFIISKAMSSPSQRLGANLMRESVEAYEAYNRGPKAVEVLFGSRREDFDPKQFVNSMASPDYVRQRNKTREIFVYLPYQMLPIYGVVRYFSDLDLNTGQIQREPLIATRGFRVDQQNQRIIFPNSLVASLRDGTIYDRGNAVGKINSFHSHQVGGDGQSRTTSSSIDPLGFYHVLVSRYYNIAYIMSPNAFNANFIQMFFFNRYDPELFELIERNPLATTYKLKI